MSLIIVFTREQQTPTVYADYSVSVRINQHEIATGAVHRHRRDDGWAVLLAQFLKQNYPEALLTARASKPASKGRAPETVTFVTPLGGRITQPSGNLIVREDGRVERVCAHGVGHPLGHVRRWEMWMGVHGCCGCCESWQAAAEGGGDAR